MKATFTVKETKSIQEKIHRIAGMKEQVKNPILKRKADNGHRHNNQDDELDCNQCGVHIKL